MVRYQAGKGISSCAVGHLKLILASRNIWLEIPQVGGRWVVIPDLELLGHDNKWFESSALLIITGSVLLASFKGSGITPSAAYEACVL